MTECKYCKKELPSNRKTFCNRECQHKNDIKPRIKLQCKICNSDFLVTEKELKRNPKYCSNKCRGLGRKQESREIRKCLVCKKEFEVYKKSTKLYCGNKCASQAVGNIRIENSIKTIKEKYGMLYVKTKEFKNKIKQTKLERYGDENYVNTKMGKQTKLERYGNENYNNIEKNKKTCLVKYGVENPSQYFLIRKKIKKTYFNKINNRLNNVVKPLFALEEYNGVVNKQYKFKCKKCNGIFEDSLDNGKIPRCKKCYPTNSPTSILEKEITDYIKSIYSGNVIENDRKILKGKELDIYLPDKKMAIEFDGLYWHSEIQGKDKKYHLEKTELCEEQGIRLIHIFEDEWLNKQDIIKSKLKHILGLSNDDKVYARNCEIKEISPKIKNEFLEINHIQGQDKSKIKLGAFYKDELVAVMTFGDKRIALGQKSVENEYELIRFATNKNVVGIAGKLFSHFIKKYKPKSVLSYADRRWTYKENSLYNAIGFENMGTTVPNYWYTQYSNRQYRFNFRKSVLNEKLEKFDQTLTEWQNMQIAGYDRIWDCGNWKFIWENDCRKSLGT